MTTSRHILNLSKASQTYMVLYWPELVVQAIWEAKHLWPPDFLDQLEHHAIPPLHHPVDFPLDNLHTGSPQVSTRDLTAPPV